MTFTPETVDVMPEARPVAFTTRDTSAPSRIACAFALPNERSCCVGDMPENASSGLNVIPRADSRVAGTP